jgi:hypothetical protein
VQARFEEAAKAPPGPSDASSRPEPSTPEHPERERTIAGPHKARVVGSHPLSSSLASSDLVVLLAEAERRDQEARERTRTAPEGPERDDAFADALRRRNELNRLRALLAHVPAAE